MLERSGYSMYYMSVIGSDWVWFTIPKFWGYLHLQLHAATRFALGSFARWLFYWMALYLALSLFESHTQHHTLLVPSHHDYVPLMHPLAHAENGAANVVAMLMWCYVVALLRLRHMALETQHKELLCDLCCV